MGDAAGDGACCGWLLRRVAREGEADDEAQRKQQLVP
eukprot:gene55063-22152_t